MSFNCEIFNVLFRRVQKTQTHPLGLKKYFKTRDGIIFRIYLPSVFAFAECLKINVYDLMDV